MNRIPGSLQKKCPQCVTAEPVSLEQVDSRLRNFRAYFKPGLSMSVPGVYAWEWHVDKASWYFSPGWSNVFKVPLSAPLDVDAWWGSIRQDDLEGLQKWHVTLLEGRAENAEVAYRMQRLDGQWAWLFNKGHISQRKDGRPCLISGVCIDVSPLRSDAKFQHGCAGVGDTSFHAMLENSPDMIVRLDRELFPLYMNPKVVEYMGREHYSYDDSLEELHIEQDQLEYLKRSVERVFAEGETIREQRTFRSPRSGQIVCGEYSFWPEYDPEGRIRSAMTHFRDFTEQVAAEQRAKLNAQRLVDLYHLTQMNDESEGDVLNFVLACLLKFTKSSSGFIFLPEQDVSGRGRMVWSLDLFGRFSAEVLRDDCLSSDIIRLTTGPDGARNYRSMCNGNGVEPFYFSFGGAMPVFRSMIAPGMDGERVVCLAGVCNKQSDYDEDDLQQLETFINGAWLILRKRRFVQELSRAKDAAQHANKVKDEFLANVSHELRTPLNGLLSMLQLLNDGGLCAAQKEYVDIALQSGKTLLRIISDILDVSRMASGKMQLDVGVFDFKHAVESTFSLFGRDAGEKGISLELTMDRNIPDALLGDEARVRQVLFNLLGNALKFTESGQISVSCSRLPAGADGKCRVYLAVADTGIGIPQEKQAAVFDPFIQADSSTTRKYGGTGLGLGIVKRLVSMMQGSVSVESEVGAGTTVHCSMVFAPKPCFATAPGCEEKSGLACCGKMGPFAGKMRSNAESLSVLVADDDDVSRFAMRAFIEREGHRVFCVPNGGKALEAISLYPFDCVFTDIQMPDMDGLELTGKIRRGELPSPEDEAALRRLLEEAFPEELLPQRCTGLAVPIVAVSAHAMSGDSERFLQQGVDYYLAKPVVMHRLQAVLESVLASRAAQAAVLAEADRPSRLGGTGRARP
ncbi:response regulator [Desulfovibrio sp. OttesenSCG-928-G15]|nr:response regulator [Desulfovibrio sp. OttesenSCG-928-G15]